MVNMTEAILANRLHDVCQRLIVQFNLLIVRGKVVKTVVYQNR